MILKSVDCNLCKSSNLKVVYKATDKDSGNNNFSYACTNNQHGEYYQLVKCLNCGLKFSSPRPDADEIESGYAGVKDEVYKEELNGRVITFQRNLENISRYKRKGSLLDIGCSIGTFLSLAKKEGWEVMGIEPSAWCVKQCRDLYNIEVIKGTHRLLANFSQKFDVVTMWDVLEHLSDPLEALRDCRSSLKDGGILVFSTLDIGSLYARILGKHWPWLMKMHIYYFDRLTIKRYLKQAGFKPIKIEKYKHTISVDYLLYKLKKINRFLYLSVKIFKQAFMPNKNNYITFGLGDIIEVYAEKAI
jgi:2-polyprenyl-3-methyl-5-hydroxy-6-metoxy-1,4-benzoquinol methylase